MKLRRVLVICRKELLEALRDRRTLLMNIGLPLILYPLLMIAAGKIVETQQAAAEARASHIAVWGRAPEGLERELTEKEATLKTWAEAPEAVRAGIEGGRFAPPPPVDSDVRKAGSRRGTLGIARPAAGKRAPGADDVTPSDAAGQASDAATPGASGQARDAAAPGASGDVGEDSKPADAKKGGAKPDDATPDPVRDAARAALARRAVDTVVVFYPPGPAGLDQVPAAVFYDSVRDDSRKAAERARDALDRLGQRILAERLEARGLPRTFAEPVTVSEQNVAKVERRLGHALGSILPLMLILLSTMGGLYPAIDMTAGEKERGTMQTLLCSPLHPVEILTGKLLAISVIACITALINIISLGASVSRMMPAELGSELSILSLLPILPIMLPLIVVVAAISLAVCLFARDFKDAMNMVTPFFLVVMLAPSIAAMPRSELNAWTALVPVVNIALLIKALLVGEAKADAVFLVMGSSLVFAAVAVLFAARVFAREQIALGGREPLRVVLGLERQRGGTPSPTLAVLFFAVLFAVMFYGTLLIEGRSIVTMMVVTQYGLMLLPVLLTVAAFGLSPRETFSLRRISLRGAVGAVIVGLSAWTFAAGVILRLFPPPGELTEAMEKLLQLGDTPSSLLLAVVLLSLTPALCEELLFRGLILSGLRPLGKWPALIGVGLMFGLLHGSIYRMAPTAFLGVLMAWAVWRTGSILAGMIIHALNNGLVVVALHVAPETLDRAESLPWWVVVVGTAVMGLGLWLVDGAGPAEDRGAGEG